eukprot:TRINITY_DN4108_c0_g1_i3.p1 TRINITY_DN4108_c0_g1~~TRINITY_DN4108_c0_g1_i3.p1  ORF type:complete len:235 (-),score=70.90 TRINITY_DN4108_c0_g1_i3:193-897(-)
MWSFGAAAWGGDEVGRLKCWGVHYYPRNAVLTLRGGGKAVVCEDVMETVVVFGEWGWVGAAAANPTEAVLPLPYGLAAVVGEGGGATIWPRGVRGGPRRAKADGGGADDGGPGDGDGGDGGGTLKGPADEVVDLDEEDEEEGEDDDAVDGGETPIRRASTRKRARIDNGDAGYQEVGSDEDGGVRQRTRGTQRATATLSLSDDRRWPFDLSRRDGGLGRWQRGPYSWVWVAVVW